MLWVAWEELGSAACTINGYWLPADFDSESNNQTQPYRATRGPNTLTAFDQNGYMEFNWTNILSILPFLPFQFNGRNTKIDAAVNIPWDLSLSKIYRVPIFHHLPAPIRHACGWLQWPRRSILHAYPIAAYKRSPFVEHCTTYFETITINVNISSSPAWNLILCRVIRA